MHSIVTQLTRNIHVIAVIIFKIIDSILISIFTTILHMSLHLPFQKCILQVSPHKFSSQHHYIIQIIALYHEHIEIKQAYLMEISRNLKLFHV